MAQRIIDIGNLADDGSGDTIRSAGAKLNRNFAEVYAFENVASDLSFDGNTIKTTVSNADLEILPSGTGSVVFPGIRFNDNNIEILHSNNDFKIEANGSGRVVIEGLGFGGTSISSSDSSFININENLIVDGTLSGTSTASIGGTFNSATGSSFGTLTLANGSITDSSGTISFGDDNVTTTGTLTGGTGSNFGNLTLANGSVTDSGGTISFGNENLSSTGTLDVSGLSTFGSVGTTGSISLAGTATIDNLTFNDNIIATSSNADLRLTPGGTGVVAVSNLTIDSSINLTDNVIKVTNTNAALELKTNGTGKIVFGSIDLDGGTVDNVVIGADSPAAGTFTSITLDPVGSGTVSTPAVLITGNQITGRRSNENVEFAANGSGNVIVNGFTLPNADGSVGQLLKTNGSGVLTFESSPLLLGQSLISDQQATITFRTSTEIDAVTAVGGHNRIESGTAVIEEFATSKYDSAFYLAVNRDDDSDEFEITKHSVVHDNSNAFITSTINAKTGTNNHIITSVDISDSKFRLKGTGSSSQSSMSYYRIGLGDNDSTGYSGEDEAAVVINTDVDSASEVIDSFAHADFRGAKYFISVNNDSKTEISNLEALVVHNGSDAFISVYNVVNTGNNDLITLTAAINGSNLEVSASGLEPNLRVHAYRIRLADDEADRSSTNINVIGEVTVSSSTTTLDTFDTGTYQAAHYIIVGHNASEGHSSITEAAVVSDGTNAFVTQYGQVSSKSTDQILLSVGHAGTTTTLSATSTSGGSTVLNAYRINLARAAGASSATVVIDEISATDFRAAKYNVQVVDTIASEFELYEANIVHDGTNAYISTFGNIGNSTDLITPTADVSGGNLRFKGTINSVNDKVVTVLRRQLNI